MDKEKQIIHPLEGVLDIEEGSTLPVVQQKSTDLVEYAEYDEKDVEIEKDLQVIIDQSMDMFELFKDNLEIVEGKYKARTGEISNEFLRTALEAVLAKKNQKENKDKEINKRNKAVAPKTVNQNLIIADRNEILRKIIDSSEDDDTN